VLAQVGVGLRETAAPAPDTDTAQGVVVDLATGELIFDVWELSEQLPLPLVEIAPLLAASRWKLAVKRAVDVIGALVALVLALPLFIVVSIVVATTSRGPILYRQQRIGRHGHPFVLLKFRSMYQDAESHLAGLRLLNDASGPIFKMKDDPRVTPIGNILRRWSIDELPQLINVLVGHMSLVGPRPPLPQEVEEYNHVARQRLLVKPGITCIWQVSGRSDVDFDRWVAMDLEYISNWSLTLDFKLLARTIPAVLGRRGAY
jgi:exopolysaccharide biosynthesis polyprenyl glycosylphosphotransferase